MDTMDIGLDMDMDMGIITGIKKFKIQNSEFDIRYSAFFYLMGI
jgi:hypothetical protein